MWFTGSTAEIAVRCPHCGEADWRMPAELKGGRMFCFRCVRVSAWPPDGSSGAGPRTPGRGGV